jgi:3-dehydrosphinganine reductase
VTALITGAGSGLGLRLAERVAERGRPIVALDVHLGAPARARLERAAAERLHIEEVDVRDGEAVRAAVARGAEALGAPALVVNCAGVQHGAAFADLDEAAFRRVVDINLIGSRNVAAAALEHLAPGGQLVLVASLAGLVPNYGYAAYCASKYGVVGLAEVLRLELRPRGIGVSVVCPPEVETPMVDAERLTELAPTRALKNLPGTLGLEPAVREILAGVEARRFLIMPGRRARATRLLTRVLPGRAARAISDRVVARALR